MNKLSIRTKIEAVGLAMLLVAIGSMSAMSTYLSYTGPNGSYAWTSTDKTFIECSNGNRYNATFADLQKACYANISGGWKVTLPDCNITVTTTLNIPSNVWLDGQGDSSILWLASGSNVTMIINQAAKGWVSAGGIDPLTTNKNIRLSNFRIEGNGLQQGNYWLGNNLYVQRRGIMFVNADDTIIENVKINNATAGGILLKHCNNSILTFLNINHWGKIFDGTGYLAYFTKGIYVENSSNVSITHCDLHDGYSSGIALEAEYPAPYEWYIKNFLIASCIIDGCSHGIYLEMAKNGVISNCILTNNTDVQLYGFARGLHCASNVYNVAITNCYAYKNGGNTADCSGIVIGGINCTASNCISEKNYGNGFDLGSYCSIIGCKSTNDSRKGIHSNGYNTLISSNQVYYAGTVGIYLEAPSYVLNKGTSIIGNTVYYTGSYGLYCGYLPNTTINGNTFHHTGNSAIYYVGRFNSISDNIITNAGSNAISIPNNNCTVMGNFIYKPTGYTGIIVANGNSNINIIGNKIIGATTGIKLTGVNHSIIANNIIQDATTGISELTSSDYNIIMGNIVTRTTTPIDVIGTNTTWWVSAANSYGFNIGAIS